jgi:DNA polymerase iota
VTPQNLEHWLDSRTGKLVWDLLHGIDNLEVKVAADVPTQISIEDTYQGLSELSEIDRELRKLTAHLLDRMRRDLAEDDHWIACPRTLRLSTRPKTSPSEEKPYNFARKSRSQPLPGFVLSLTASIDELTDRLVQQAILPMFFQLNPGKGGWRIGMLNICMANMTLTGTEDGSGVGRNISKMFQRQEETLREWTVYDTVQPDLAFRTTEMLEQDHTWDEEMDEASDEASSMAADAQEVCPLCGHYFPAFATAAHERYHKMENS